MNTVEMKQLIKDVLADCGSDLSLKDCEPLGAQQVSIWNCILKCRHCDPPNDELLIRINEYGDESPPTQVIRTLREHSATHSQARN